MDGPNLVAGPNLDAQHGSRTGPFCVKLKFKCGRTEKPFPHFSRAPSIHSSSCWLLLLPGCCGTTRQDRAGQGRAGRGGGSSRRSSTAHPRRPPLLRRSHPIPSVLPPRKRSTVSERSPSLAFLPSSTTLLSLFLLASRSCSPVHSKAWSCDLGSPDLSIPREDRVKDRVFVWFVSSLGTNNPCSRMPLYCPICCCERSETVLWEL